MNQHLSYNSSFPFFNIPVFVVLLQSVRCDLTPQISKETNTVTQTKPRIVTFKTPDSSPPSFLQQSLKLNCPKQGRGSGPNQPQDEVIVSLSLYVVNVGEYSTVIFNPYNLLSIFLFSSSYGTC